MLLLEQENIHCCQRKSQNLKLLSNEVFGTITVHWHWMSSQSDLFCSQCGCWKRKETALLRMQETQEFIG